MSFVNSEVLCILTEPMHHALIYLFYSTIAKVERIFLSTFLFIAALTFNGCAMHIVRVRPGTGWGQ